MQQFSLIPAQLPVSQFNFSECERKSSQADDLKKLGAEGESGSDETDTDGTGTDEGESD